MKILVLAPHTDDETLGCGSSIAHWVAKGYQVHVLCFSTCYESLPAEYRGWGDTEPVITERELGDACDILGCTFSIHEHPVRNFPEHRQSILDVLTYYKTHYKPDLVVGPSLHDVHQDHRTVAEESRRCFWRNCNIISYNLPWNCDGFKANLFVESTYADYLFLQVAGEAYISQQPKMTEFINRKTCLIGANGDKEGFEVIRWSF